MASILSGVTAFFNAIFSVNSTNPGMATQLITWLTTSGNELALVGLYLYILNKMGATQIYYKTEIANSFLLSWNS